MFRSVQRDAHLDLHHLDEKGNETVAKTAVHTAHAPQPAGPYIAALRLDAP
jgi:hypothetical protein